MDWKPIKTAPKEIEFRCLLAHEFSVVIGYWDGTGWVNERSRQPIPRCYYKPTHWAELPALPGRTPEQTK
jgi:hypothetical protein